MFLEPRPVGANGYYISLSSTTRYRTDEDQMTTDTSLDRNSFILMLIAVVIVPIACTFLLCTIIYCIYRYNRKLTYRAPTNVPIAPNDRNNTRIATVIYNNQHSPFIYEESPPSYESLADIKKNTSNRSLNTNEQYPLTILPSTTSTNTNATAAAAAAAAIVPTAPTPPPPSYHSLEQSDTAQSTSHI